MIKKPFTLAIFGFFIAALAASVAYFFSPGEGSMLLPIVVFAALIGICLGAVGVISAFAH
jgi:hypothetical protein